MGIISDILEMAEELPVEKRKLLIKQLQRLNDNESGVNETALLSESALAVDWNRKEEDKAWQAYQ